MSYILFLSFLIEGELQFLLLMNSFIFNHAHETI